MLTLSDCEVRCLIELMSRRNSSAGVLSFTWSWHSSGTSARGSLNEVRRKCGKPNCTCGSEICRTRAAVKLDEEIGGTDADD